MSPALQDSLLLSHQESPLLTSTVFFLLLINTSLVSLLSIFVGFLLYEITGLVVRVQLSRS